MSKIQTPRTAAESAAAVAVTSAGLVTLFEKVLNFNYTKMLFDIATVTQALQALAVQVKPTKDSNYETYNAAWSTAGSILLYKSGDLAALSAAAKGGAILNINSVYAVRVQAQSATGTAAVTINAIFVE